MAKNVGLLTIIGGIFVVVMSATNIAHTLGWADHYTTMELDSFLSTLPASKHHFTAENSNQSTTTATTKSIGKESIPAKNDPIAAVAEPKAENTTTTTTNDEAVRPIELLLPPEEIDWIRRRNQTYFEFFIDWEEREQREHRWWASIKDANHHNINATTGRTNYDEDTQGPWMDFLIAGHPKTGTTTLVANLAKVAPMKVKDFCTGKPSTLLYYLMDAWPRKFPEILQGPRHYVRDERNFLVGSKCPQFIGNPEMMSRFSLAHPRMKLIIGIRHPIDWFNSFIRMGHSRNLYRATKLCPHYANIDPISGIPGGIPYDRAIKKHRFERCINECRCGSPICFHRSRLHMGLARMGKTKLSPEERQLLAPQDPDGGMHFYDAKVRNPIFVYDQTQMKEDSYWDELATFLGLSYIPNEHYHSSRGYNRGNLTLCVPFYDQLRSQIMEHSYNMSVWLEDYLLPLGLDAGRPDVVIANTSSFRNLVQTYRSDPCGRLVRNATDGTFVLDAKHWVGNQTSFEVQGQNLSQCRAVYLQQPKPKEKAESNANANEENNKRNRARNNKRNRARNNAAAAANPAVDVQSSKATNGQLSEANSPADEEETAQTDKAADEEEHDKGATTPKAAATASERGQKRSERQRRKAKQELRQMREQRRQRKKLELHGGLEEDAHELLVQEAIRKAHEAKRKHEAAQAQA